MNAIRLWTFTISAIGCLASASAVTIDLVPIANPGNAPDTEVMTTDGTTGYGSVGHMYWIGKYEITAGQYTEFLNAVAKADPNELYTPMMDYDSDPNTFGANIKRTGISGSYIYSVAPDWANRPVGNVSLWDAARFANWLHNSQPTGPQGSATTEAGAYHDVGDLNLFGRNAGARFFVPTDDEWYKAAYHDRTAGLAGSYFDYSTRSNTAPGIDVTEATNPGNNANNYYGEYVIGAPYYRTEVGEFELSRSPYGTFDQEGNVWEWTETPNTIGFRHVRGGSFSFAVQPSVSYRPMQGPGAKLYNIGFRVASSVPEPNGLLLTGLGMAGTAKLGRRAPRRSASR